MICAREFTFCCAHRLAGHEGKCANLHGHNYKVVVSVKRKELDPLGRVVDFSVLKERIGAWIDENWDHALFVYTNDSKMMALKDSLGEIAKIFLFPFNPTAENMALYLLNEICPKLLSDVQAEAFKVELWETDSNRVGAELR